MNVCSTTTIVMVAVAISITGLFSAQQSLPLPVVKRDARPPKSAFERPALIVVGEVGSKCTNEEVDVEGRSYGRPRLHREIGIRIRYVARVNERSDSEPNLESRRFSLQMKDGDELDLAFGKTYVLMVKFVPSVLGIPWVQGAGTPRYVLALEDAGFEIDGARARVLRRGGALAAYDGQLTSDVLAAIGRTSEK